MCGNRKSIMKVSFSDVDPTLRQAIQPKIAQKPPRKILLEKTTTNLHGGKEHKKNTTMSSKKNTLEKTLNHMKSSKKETTLKTSMGKAPPNSNKVNSTTPQASTVMRIQIPHKINFHLTTKQISQTKLFLRLSSKGRTQHISKIRHQCPKNQKR